MIYRNLLILRILLAWLSEHPSAKIIGFAQEIIDFYGAERMPDWVNALANGNPDAIDAVIEVALADYREEASNASEL